MYIQGFGPVHGKNWRCTPAPLVPQALEMEMSRKYLGRLVETYYKSVHERKLLPCAFLGRDGGMHPN